VLELPITTLVPGIVALGPSLVAELLGVLFTWAALAPADGPPIAGGLISSSGGYLSTVVDALWSRRCPSASLLYGAPVPGAGGDVGAAVSGGHR
jgi:hypothetical protein